MDRGKQVERRAGAARARSAPAAGAELRYLCIQAREGSMPDAEAADDGERLGSPVAWP